MAKLNFTKSEKILFFFTLGYILLFFIYYYQARNYEFIWYILTLLFFFLLVVFTYSRAKFSPIILWGLSSWGLLHMLGGSARIGGKVLYGLVLIPMYSQSTEFTILKYDQVIHFLGFGLTAIISYHLLKPHLKENFSRPITYFIVWLTGMGFGALNEVVEFVAVVISGKTGVGGYYNNALDLVFNMLGAAAALLLIHFRRKKFQNNPKRQTDQKLD